MSNRLGLSTLFLGLFAVCAATPALAGLCTGKYVESVHRAEAAELRVEAYAQGSNCDPGSETCWVGNEDYDAIIIGCNRKRDVKPFGLGPIKDLPLVHGPAGKTLDKRTAEQRRFADNLPPRAVVGQIQYFGKFPKWYGYILQRKNGNWIATTVMDFKFPNAEKKNLHLPAYLAARLSNTKGGRPLTETTCKTASTGKNDHGMIIEDWGRPFHRACRIDREAKLFLIDDGDRTDLDYIDETKGFTESRPAKHWLMYYWRAVVENVWSRPDGSFQMKLIIANLAGKPGEVKQKDLDMYKKVDLIYEMEFHHKEGRSNNMYRPIEVLGLKIYKATYAGLHPTGVAHEFGHSLGFDDEYPSDCDNNAPPGICNAKPNKDCQRLSGYIEGVDTVNPEEAYAMCDEFDYSGQKEYPDIVQPHSVKAVYPWIVSQRYSIGEEIPDCDEDSDCKKKEWCKKLGGVNKCVPKLANGEGCHRPNQCLSDLCPVIDLKCAECVDDEHCKGGEFCKTAKVLSENICKPKHKIGESCSRPGQCFSGFCPAIDLLCGECNSKEGCKNDEYCKDGTPGKANSCEPKRVNGASCTEPKHCRSGLCPALDLKCAECTNDNHCKSDEYCKKGTVGVGANVCVPKKNKGASCIGPAECKSGLCPVPDLKCVECTKDGHCDNDEYCKEGTFGIGENKCVDKKKNGEGCGGPAQCKSGLCPAPDFKCVACTKDGHCDNDEYCDEGTLGIGENKCKKKKSKGDKCSRGKQCKSGCCKFYKFKWQCRPC